MTRVTATGVLIAGARFADITWPAAPLQPYDGLTTTDDLLAYLAAFRAAT